MRHLSNVTRPRRRAGLLVAALCTAPVLVARPAAAQQDPDPQVRGEIMAVVDGLFDAMRAADADAIRAAFYPGIGSMASSGIEKGSPVVAYGDLEEFASAVAGAQPGDLDEQIGPAEIRLDDNLATVFTPYVFNYKGQLSHCGVDVFLIARTDAGWKIVGLADTRRRESCEEWLK